MDVKSIPANFPADVKSKLTSVITEINKMDSASTAINGQLEPADYNKALEITGVAGKYSTKMNVAGLPSLSTDSEPTFFQKYKWWLIGAGVIILVVGGAFLIKKGKF